VEQHYELLDSDPFDPLLVAAEVLGRHSRKFLIKSEAISTRILNVLKSNLEDASQSAIARDWARNLDRDIWLDELFSQSLLAACVSF